MSINTAVRTLPSLEEEVSEPIEFELLADATDFVELAYQPVCAVVCSDKTVG